MHIKLKNILTEKNMPVEDAIKVFLKYGIDPTKLSKDELNKEWRLLAVKLHPDKGGNEEEMKVLNAAFDSLRDIDGNINLPNKDNSENEDDVNQSDIFGAGMHQHNQFDDDDENETPPRGYNFGYSHDSNKTPKFDEENVIDIDYIINTQEDEDLSNTKRCSVVEKFIRKHFPYMFSIKYKDKRDIPRNTSRPPIDGSWQEDVIRYPIAGMFGLDPDKENGYIYRFYDILREFQKYTSSDSTEYPNLKKDSQTVVDFMLKIRNTYNINNVNDPKNYPLFITLYVLYEVYGGDEEGGRYIRQYEMYRTPSRVIDGKVHKEVPWTVKVKDYKQAERAAKWMFDHLPVDKYDGQPKIVLEKISGMWEEVGIPPYM